MPLISSVWFRRSSSRVSGISSSRLGGAAWREQGGL